MYKLTLLTLSIMICLISCGPNAEQQAAIDKQKNDSISNVAAQKVKDSIAIEQHKIEIAAQKEEIESTLQTLRVSLIAENAKMDEIKEYQLLRSADEKEQQINAQASVIQDLESNIERLVKELEDLK